MFPSLPVYTFYGTTILAWFDYDFKFAVITKHLLLKLMELIFTMSIFIFFLVSSCFLVYAVHLFVSSTSVDLFLVVDLSACCTLLSICWTSPGQIAGTTVAAFLFHGLSGLCLQLYLHLSLYPFPHAYPVKVFCFI